MVCPIRYSEVNNLFKGRGGGEAGSIFGDPLSLTKEQNLMQFLAERTSKIPTLILTASDNLRDVEEELKQLALSETKKT